MNVDFGGKVAVVTGGASGIGAAICRDLVACGARVVIADFNVQGAAALAAELGESTLSHGLDVGDPAAVEAMVGFAQERFGALHLAVNNAGITGTLAPLADVSLDDWHHVINVDLNSVFYCMKYEIPAMIAAGGGAIVNMSSILGSVGFANSAGYIAAKHGVVGLTRAASMDYSSNGVRVNAIGPGFINTPLIQNAMTDVQRDGLASLHPIGRLGTPEDVAALATFLLSDRAAFITGSYQLVDGGYTSR